MDYSTAVNKVDTESNYVVIIDPQITKKFYGIEFFDTQIILSESSVLS